MGGVVATGWLHDRQTRPTLKQDQNLSPSPARGHAQRKRAAHSPVKCSKRVPAGLLRLSGSAGLQRASAPLRGNQQPVPGPWLPAVRSCLAQLAVSSRQSKPVRGTRQCSQPCKALHQLPCRGPGSWIHGGALRQGRQGGRVGGGQWAGRERGAGKGRAGAGRVAKGAALQARGWFQCDSFVGGSSASPSLLPRNKGQKPTPAPTTQAVPNTHPTTHTPPTKPHPRTCLPALPAPQLPTPELNSYINTRVPAQPAPPLPTPELNSTSTPVYLLNPLHRHPPQS